MEMIFTLANAQEYSDESCAALQLLCNLALTPAGCLLLRNRICFFYRILETRDPYLLRQVLAVLVNLSCDLDSSQALLNSEVLRFFLIDFSLGSVSLVAHTELLLIACSSSASDSANGHISEEFIHQGSFKPIHLHR
ncbi:hypothetical protein CLF_108474 [Clonorchis sinensis]|uniref:Armadillo repeat-containing domain-containing protein n=1 Tax=Clonorchis sinensis TaxID=79923 RepID=G7YI44_CLOSI|nr:hypothetical protein CLF_108474 [Clonorchis sinensis]